MTLTARLTTAMVALVLVTAGALSVLSTFMAGVIAVLGAILLAAMLARSLALPIEQMSAAVQAFGRDEWMAVPVDAGGEVGVLARSFERMAKEVREKTRALRQEVDTRERAVAALRDSLSRQEAVFASPLVGILTLNESGSIESLNPEAERIFGSAGETLVRRDISRLIDLRSGDGIGTGARLRQLVTQDGEPRELVGRCGDGTTFPIDCVLGEMAVGGRRMFVMFVRNISKRKRNERLKDDFVATVSHELRTPLTSIAGSLGLLIGGASGKLPASAARLLSIAYTNSQRLVRLINDILDIEKIESGKVAFDLQPVDLRPLIEQAIEANRGFADGYGARIVLDPAAADRDGARRCRPHDASRDKSAFQRGQIFADGRSGRDFDRVARRYGAGFGARSRSRNPRRVQDAHLRQVRAGGRLRRAPERRHRPGAQYCQADHHATWRQDRLRGGARRGHHLLFRTAADRSGSAP